MWKSKFYGAFVLNRRVVLHAIDATPARWRGDAGSSPLDRARTASSSLTNDLLKNGRVHPRHWLISTQVDAADVDRLTLTVAGTARAGAWVQGKVVLFDDSYEHDVVHAGARDRVVLDLSVDHPSFFLQGGRGEL